jgi:hypothetical protein
MRTTPDPYRGLRFPAEIIAHAVWLYHRFSLSLRGVETILVQRGIVVSYESTGPLVTVPSGLGATSQASPTLPDRSGRHEQERRSIRSPAANLTAPSQDMRMD